MKEIIKLARLRIEPQLSGSKVINKVLRCREQLGLNVVKKRC